MNAFDADTQKLYDAAMNALADLKAQLLVTYVHWLTKFRLKQKLLDLCL